ncbi:MAG TPA: hypothetical protein VK590_12320, partial [Saprospiraceae bacterium]|nr:hypothetical protein [Saprospiraceae bacterium]
TMMVLWANLDFGIREKIRSRLLWGLKSVVTKNSRMIIPEFGWQARFHDHIIKDHDSFARIQNYIVNNPLNWKEDKFNMGTDGLTS